MSITISTTTTTNEVSSARHQLPAFRLVQSSRTIRRFANILLFLLILTIPAMSLLPWQQSARGTGNVIAYVPQERRQTVTAPVKGIIAVVAPNLKEGARVSKGDFILELQPNAPNLVAQLNSQQSDLETKLATSVTKADLYSQQIEDYSDARDFAVAAAEELVDAAQAKLQGKQDVLKGYEAKELQARQNYERQKTLFEKKLLPEKEFEKYKKDWDVELANLNAAKQEVVAAGKELAAKQNELQQKQREMQIKVDYARTMLEDAKGQQATVQKEITDLKIKLGELDRRVVTAPKDGTIFRLPLYEQSQVVKEGEELFTIVPDTSERAVELWVSGNDTPLVNAGDHVRLQFEGFPAIQFSGFPQMAAGTFGGEIVAIDPTDDGTGKFRVQVCPSTKAIGRHCDRVREPTVG
ncbi:MAG: HlyD family efflux transporter periplasmic adaptor subunit [Pirellulaceae bacterium]